MFLYVSVCVCVLVNVRILAPTLPRSAPTLAVPRHPRLDVGGDAATRVATILCPGAAVGSGHDPPPGDGAEGCRGAPSTRQADTGDDLHQRAQASHDPSGEAPGRGAAHA